MKELPKNRGKFTGNVRALAQSAVERLVELAGISLELAQVAIAPADGQALPAWFVVEAAREIPALAGKKLG